MSNLLVKANNHGSSGTPSHSYQSCWMSRWTQPLSKQGSLIDPHSQSFSREEGLDHKRKRLRRTLEISSDMPKSYGIIGNNTKAETVGLTDEKLTIRAQNFRKQRSDNGPFCFLGHFRNGKNILASTAPRDPSCSDEANSPGVRKCNPSQLLVFDAHERADFDLLPQSNLKATGNFPTTHLPSGREGLVVSKSSQDNVACLTTAVPHVCIDVDNPSKVMVFERHFSNNNFTSPDQKSNKYERYSAILVRKRLVSGNHSKEVEDDSNPEFFASQADPSSSCHECQPLFGLPSSMRNVKTMRICTNVDSVRKSHGSPPLFSQTAAHHFLFSKQTGVNLSEGQPVVQESTQSTQHNGVKIQPLWSSTDNEKDNLGDAGIPKGDRSHDLSAETATMDMVVLSNKNDFSGVLLPPLVKHTMKDKSLLTASVDPRQDKARGKLPVTEVPDSNSMHDVEPSTSRTQSLDAEHLFSCAEQRFKSKSKQYNEECSLSEPSSWWVKRLKLGSFGMGESSSQEKTHMFCNTFIKRSRTSSETSMGKHQSKELSISEQNGGPIMDGESSSKKSKNTILQCSWIQRWCQDRSIALHGHPRKSVVICEPDSSKLPFDELQKQQFPSIAARALTGKSLNGFHPCKFTKDGPLVVWNTEH